MKRIQAPTLTELRLIPCVGALTLMACGSDAIVSPSSSQDPATAEIVTSDLVHFWSAYDAGGKDGSSSAFQSKYLDVASDGLKDFVRVRSLTASSLVAMVGRSPQYFAAIRAPNLSLTTGAIDARIRANYATIKSLYPASVFPRVTLLIGRFSTGGTTAQSGMLIGSEFYSATPTTPLAELQPFQRDNVKMVDSLPLIVAHEHAHILQGRAGGVFSHPDKNLLEQSLMEGGADFIGERSSGGNINGRLWPIAVPMEAALWQDFKAEMHGTDVSRWLYNQGSGTVTPTRPGDLGYFIGYRIVEAYYLKQADKTAALRAIIEMQDADAFLVASGYSP